MPSKSLIILIIISIATSPMISYATTPPKLAQKIAIQNVAQNPTSQIKLSDLIPSISSPDGPSAQDLQAVMPLIKSNIKILSANGLDMTDLSKWVDSPEKQKELLKQIPWDMIRDESVGDLTHLLDMYQSSPAVQKKIADAQARHDQEEADRIGKTWIAKLRSEIWLKVGAVKSLFSMSTLITFLADAGQEITDLPGDVKKEVKGAIKFTFFVGTIAAILAPFIGPYLEWLKTESNYHFATPNGGLRALFQGAKRKAKRAAKEASKLKEGEDLSIRSKVFAMPGVASDRIGKFLHDLSAKFGPDQQKAANLLNSDQKATRDSFKFVVFQSLLDYLNNKTSSEANETTHKILLDQLEKKIMDRYHVPEAELERVKDFDRKIEDLRFKDPKSPELIKMAEERVKLFDQLQKTYKADPKLLADFRETYQRVLGARDAQALQLVAKAFFDLTYPEDNRAFSDPEVRAMIEANREAGGYYRAIEEVGKIAQARADRLGIPVNFEAQYEARGYGLEEYLKSPAYIAHMKAREHCIANGLVRENWDNVIENKK